jgi:hypothetical protein
MFVLPDSLRAKVVSSLFWDVTRRILVVADVSGQPIAAIFKGQVNVLSFENTGDRFWGSLFYGFLWASL